MKNVDNVVSRGTIWHIAYHFFKLLDIPADIWCPHWGKNGWMQHSGIDPVKNDQIIGMHKVALTKGH